MGIKELSLDDDINYPIDADEEDALADGMIPDSRIVRLIDELEIANDDFDDSGDAESTLESLGLR